MAKKKQAAEAAPAEAPGTAEYVAAALAEVEKNFGAGIVRSGRDVVNSPPMVIPVSPKLNGILGGGIPSGSWVSVAGPEKCGKSVSMLDFAATCQRPEYGSRPVMMLATEHRADPLLLTGIQGLNLDPPMFYLVQSTKGRILNSVDFLNIGLTFLKSVPGGVLLTDSVSSLVNPKTLTDGIGSSDFGTGNRLVSQFIDCAVPVVKANDCIVIGIVQYYTNTSGYGKKWSEKAPKKWFYQSDVRLACEKFAYDHGNGEDEAPTGQTLNWFCQKAALCGPGGKTESHIRFGVGIDKVKELLSVGCDFGLVEKSGSWVTFNFLAAKPDLLPEGKDAVSAQGMEKAYRLLEENPAWRAELDRQVTELVAPDPAAADKQESEPT